jgi:hypothetical protein
VSPVRYELGFYIPEDAILHNYCRETSILHEMWRVSSRDCIVAAGVACCIVDLRQGPVVLLLASVPHSNPRPGTKAFC